MENCSLLILFFYNNLTVFYVHFLLSLLGREKQIVPSWLHFQLGRVLQLVNFAGRILQEGLLNLKLLPAVKMSSEDSFKTYLKALYADREKRREHLQDEEN